MKDAKYRQLANSHIIFVPVAIETARTCNQLAVELMQEMGRRISAITEDTRKSENRLPVSAAVRGSTTGGMRSPSVALSPPNKRHSHCFQYNVFCLLALC